MASPDHDHRRSPTHSFKRRPSSPSLSTKPYDRALSPCSPSAKKPRLGPVPYERQRSSISLVSVPVKVQEEEKRRGKRLFGGLLNALGQEKGPARGTKRGTRQCENGSRADRPRQGSRTDDGLGGEEKDGERAERLGRLHVARKRARLDFEDQMHETRFRQMRETAGLLKTNTGGIGGSSGLDVFYRPKILLPAQQQIIDEQLANVELLVEKERTQVEHDKARRLAELETETKGKADNEGLTCHGPYGGPDEAGDVVINADEDTVIY